MTFWKAIERFAESAQGCLWRSLLKDDYLMVRKAFLRPSSDLTAQLAGRKPAVLLWPPDLEPVQPTHDYDFVWMELDWERLGSAIVRAFDLPRKTSQMRGVPNTWQIAELSTLPIILTVQREAEAFRGVAAELAAKRRDPFALLAPTRQHMDADTEELLVPCRAGFFDLETLLTLLPSGLLAARESGGKLFSPLLPEQRDALKEAEAGRLCKFLRQLGEESNRRRKAPLQKVFRLLVLEKRSKSEVARMCKCVLALITLRVGELEARLGLKLEKMLECASRVNEMEAEKDQRARSLYRKGLTDDTGDDE